MQRATTNLTSPPTWTVTELGASKLHIWRMDRHVPTFHMATSCRAAEMPARNIGVTLRGEGNHHDPPTHVVRCRDRSPRRQSEGAIDDRRSEGDGRHGG